MPRKSETTASRIRVKTESHPIRCEICHQTDYFNAELNQCSRCGNIAEQLAPLPAAEIETGPPAATFLSFPIAFIFPALLFFIPVILAIKDLITGSPAANPGIPNRIEAVKSWLVISILAAAIFTFVAISFRRSSKQIVIPLALLFSLIGFILLFGWLGIYGT